MAKRERSLFGLGMLVAAGSVFFLIRRFLGEGEPAPPRPAPAAPSARPETAAPLQKAAKPLPAPAAGEAPADDLEAINGIGATYARRLRAAGIRTFAALAALTPEEARKAAKAQPWQADPDDWIAQAKERVESGD